MSEKTIPISPQAYDRLIGLAKKQGLSPDEYAIQIVEEKLRSEDKFYDGRKFGIPEDSFILFALPKHEWNKLKEWFEKEERVNITIGSNGEVWLLNEDRRYKKTA